MYDRVLITTDGSQNAEAAARHGMTVAEAFDATVHILSVVDSRSYSEQLAEVDQLVRDQRAALEARARECVTTIEGIVDDESSADRVAVIVHGNPYEAILSYASENAIDLLVMGSQGLSGLDRFLLGSVTERVVRLSDVPVLSVPPGAIEREPSGYDSILIPTDGSSAANAAVDHGLAMAERFDSATHVLYVIRSGKGLPSPSDPARVAAEEAVGTIETVASNRDVEVATYVYAGTPYDRIRNFVDDHDIDLVAMGTHGESGLVRNILGGVTERVLRTSRAPVVTVRLPKTE